MRSSDTKQRILAVSRELFARQGYTGTTIVDIARGVGTTTAALYYHFSSKAEILGGLLEEPLAAYFRILGILGKDESEPADILGALIDLNANARELAAIVNKDPSVVTVLDERLPRSSAQLNADVVAKLAGPRASRAGTIRAHAALAVVKDATLAAVQLSGGTLVADDRAEVLATALRTLDGTGNS